MISVSQALKFFKNHNIFNASKFFKTDGKILINCVLICIIGLAEIYSAADRTTGNIFGKQLFVFCFFAPILFSIIPAINPKFIIKYCYLGYFIALVLLGLVLVVGDYSMGARRWIEFAGFRLQPSEFVKVFLVLAVSRFLHFKKAEKIGSIFNYPVVLLFICIPCAMIFLQPDLGTALIIFAIGGFLIFTSGLRYVYVLACLVVALVSIPVLWSHMHEYQKERVRIFLNPDKDPLGSGYNIIQSKIAIGSGGLIGAGYANGSQVQLNFLPESHTDFIFTHFAEEFGFVGVAVLLCLYIALLFQIFSVSVNADSHFIRLASAGIGFSLFLHMFVNIGMTTGILPVVGSPLPFMSYGGSFLLSNLLNISLIMNFSLNRRVQLSTSSKMI
jgi:rod shape determining protein RodA